MGGVYRNPPPHIRLKAGVEAALFAGDADTINCGTAVGIWSGKTAVISIAIPCAVGAGTWLGKQASVTTVIDCSIGVGSWLGKTAIFPVIIAGNVASGSWVGKTAGIGTSIPCSVGTGIWSALSATLPSSIAARAATGSWIGRSALYGSVLSASRRSVIQNFTLGGITIPIVTTLDFSQSYQEEGGFGLTRMSDGGAVQQVNWIKTRTVLSGRGKFPQGLWALPLGQTYTLRCGAHRALDGNSNIFTLPAARRTDQDYLPIGFAVLSDGVSMKQTVVSLLGDTATLTAVDGALAYHIHFWPEMTVWIQSRDEDSDVRRNNYRWNIQCEEA